MSQKICLPHQIWTQNCQVAISGSGGVREGKHTSCLYFKSSRRPRGRGMCCCSGRSVWPTAALRSVATRTVSPGRWRNVTHTRWRPSSPANQKKVQKHPIPSFLLTHQSGCLFTSLSFLYLSLPHFKLFLLLSLSLIINIIVNYQQRLMSSPAHWHHTLQCFHWLTELWTLSCLLSLLLCSVFSAPAAAPGGLPDGAQPSAGLQPRESHPLPAVGVSEALERPAARRAHLTPLQRRYSCLIQNAGLQVCTSPISFIFSDLEHRMGIPVFFRGNPEATWDSHHPQAEKYI